MKLWDSFSFSSATVKANVEGFELGVVLVEGGESVGGVGFEAGFEVCELGGEVEDVGAELGVGDFLGWVGHCLSFSVLLIYLSPPLMLAMLALLGEAKASLFWFPFTKGQGTKSSFDISILIIFCTQFFYLRYFFYVKK